MDQRPAIFRNIGSSAGVSFAAVSLTSNNQLRFKGKKQEKIQGVARAPEAGHSLVFRLEAWAKAFFGCHRAVDNQYKEK
ncbi:MAG TPA: hypothetical protein ENN79_06670 [Desulfobacteraceae bacterium]|nr:hypothetical protein [Desulfobacteraceae bacterium]